MPPPFKELVCRQKELDLDALNDLQVGSSLAILYRTNVTEVWQRAVILRKSIEECSVYDADGCTHLDSIPSGIVEEGDDPPDESLITEWQLTFEGENKRSIPQRLSEL
eukprot:6213541-Pleurochrysis_carterae.AAC.1